ncbi:MAG TPA: energy transducer TonB [Candidatus Acidoferrum sp.]|nr:energy transducer TonB [Candidatus Acidoferrum sp.]
MRDPLSRDFSALQPEQDSWIHRVRDNFQQLLTPTRIFPSSANGAPIHLVVQGKSARSNKAHTVSALTHAAIIASLALVAIHPPGRKLDPWPPTGKVPSVVPMPRDLLETLRGHNPSGGTSGGMGHDLLPPTQGNLPPRSSIQIVKPMIPQNQHPETPIPPTILDASAPRILTPVENIGLPWMADQNNSSGRGKGNTIGEGPNNESMGNIPGSGVGIGGPPGPYRPGVTGPTCAYCPDPEYTDEAREAKLQGHVLLEVLVGADGRASQVRIVQGIGLGLDERAAQAIRGWKFVPAYDAGHRAVPSWVTIEAIFRLF